MKSLGALALLLLTASLVVPTAAAQVTIDPIPALPGPIPYEGSATLTVSGTVACADILQAMAANGGASAPIALVVEAPPAWLTATSEAVNLASQDSVVACAQGAGSRTFELPLTLAVTKDAPGIVDHPIQVVAAMGGGPSSDPVEAIFTVAYNIDYSVVADVEFPLTVAGSEVSFNVTVTQGSNARSMVMIQGTAASAGVLSGIPAVVYENEAGKPASATYQVRFKAPPTPGWGNATATFTAYGHYLLLDGRAGEFGEGCAGETRPTCDAEGTVVTYAFAEGQGGQRPGEDGGSRDAPAPVAPLAALGLVALAAFIRRR